MSFAPAATVIAPSLSVHLGVPPSSVCQLSQFLPSNRTIASDGASPGFGAGVTIRGCGSQISVDSGVFFEFSCANAGSASIAPSVRSENGLNAFMVVYFDLKVICDFFNLSVFIVLHHAMNNKRSIEKFQVVLAR